MNTKLPVPPPPPDLDNTPGWASNPLAMGEEKNWPYEKELQGQRYKNSMWALKATGVVTVILIWFFVLVFIAAMSSWIWHQISPTYWQWMTDIQLSKIQSVIFSGAIGAIVSTYVQKHISK